MKKEFILTSLVALTIFFMAGLWAVDIGASALATGVLAVEGFSFIRTPSQHYHLGLVTATVTFFIMAVITIKLLMKEETKNNVTPQ